MARLKIQKMVRTRRAFHVLTSTCASQHNGMHFFEFSTSKSGPNLVCFGHFDIKMWFAPQRRTLFEHLSSQKCSDPCVFAHFHFGMCFARDNGVRFFQHVNSQLFQKCSEPDSFFAVLTSKCALRHNGVQFFIPHLARWLRTRCFSEPTFRLSGAFRSYKTLEKHSDSDLRRFYLFVHLHLLSSDFFSSLIFFLLLFSSLILPTSAFSSVHIVGNGLNFLRYPLYTYK